jgi:hypothetical protein
MIKRVEDVSEAISVPVFKKPSNGTYSNGPTETTT